MVAMVRPIGVRAPLFQLGRTLITPGAMLALVEHGVSAGALLARHVRGDWGQLSGFDAQANAEALKSGARLMSVYAYAPGKRVWVITEAIDANGVRRSTCILLPEEY